MSSTSESHVLDEFPPLDVPPSDDVPPPDAPPPADAPLPVEESKVPDALDTEKEELPPPDIPVPSEEESKPQRKRTLTEKGHALHIETKRKQCSAKRAELTKQRRNMMKLKGECDKLATWKKEYGRAQILFDEYKEMSEELTSLAAGEEDLVELMYQQHDKVMEEWTNFERDVQKEIEHLQYLEETQVENMSAVSGGSRKSGRKSVRKSVRKSGGSVGVQSICNSLTSSKQEKMNLRKEEAALKTKLAFSEEKRRLMIAGLEEERKRLDAEKVSQIAQLDREERLGQLQLKEEIAEKQAQLEVFQEIEMEEFGLSKQDLLSVPPANKAEDLKKFFSSQECSPPTNGPVYFPAESAEVPAHPVTSQSVPELAPELAPEADSSSPPPCGDEVQRNHAPNTSQNNHGWDRVADSLERCVTLLAEENKQHRSISHKIAAANQLPKITIPVFSGDPLQFPMWENSFKALVDMKPLDVDTKMNYLNQYVSGKPKHLVEHYMLIGTEDAYLQARNVLKERYGNSSVVSTAFTSKLRQWPKITQRDSAGLRDFSDFLGKVEAARATTPSLGVLDYASENAHLVEKLPFNLETKWRDKIEQWRHIHGQGAFPPFTEFVKFVRIAADKANIPELQNLNRGQDKNFSTPAKQRQSQHVKSQHVKQNTSAFATTTSQGGNSGEVMSSDKSSCLFCNKNHPLEQCRRFMRKTFAERKDFFFKKRICMGCAASSEHQVKDCQNKKSCSTCSGPHLTCLHRNPRNQAQAAPPPSQSQPPVAVPKQPNPVEGTSNCLNVCSHPDQDGEGEHCMIIPVLVRSASNPGKESLEYAVLDDQSNSCFITESLCNRLNIQGPDTQLLLTTMQQRNAHVTSQRITGLEVLDVDREHVVQLPACYSRAAVPARQSQIPKPEIVKQWGHLEHLAERMMPYDPTLEISLLIGSNCPSVVRPREVIAGGENDPYGQKSLLGWGVIGRVCKSPIDNQVSICNKMMASETYPHFVYGTKTREIFNAERVLQVLESDFSQTSVKGKPYSAEDSRFISILEAGIKKRPDGHYEMPLPLSSDDMSLPHNRVLALKRWNQLKARFKKNPKFLEDYREFMSEVITNCAERVPPERLQAQDGKVNYVPHTGVYHPKKPDKIRVVFDCSAQYGGVALNDHLLQGPDMINGLLGVLCRFREEEVAFMTDIKGMFHQFHVPEDNRDLLRFLWWEDGDPTKDVVDYRMTVHLFGAASSPGCAIFGLRRAADDGEDEFGSAAAAFIRRDFYVDDGLKSVPTVQEAVDLIKASQGICAKAGLKLHKVTSNKTAVIEAIPPDDRAKGLKELDLKIDPLPIERALGVTWCIESDTFQFRIELRDRPCTRRGILSTVSSIYDPNGYVAPVTLKGKQILQQMCRDKLDWDSPIPESLRPLWEKWRSECLDLEQLQIKRCYKPDDFGRVKLIELHHFSDASEDGYGQCSYLRLVNERNEAHCSFVMGKARVTPLKHVTIPRLELAAATVSARTSEFLRAELSYQEIQEFFWTDSKIVLGYVTNDARRFHVYVANRVQQIRDSSDPNSWQYVDTSCNPADEASRGLTAKQLVEKSRWLTGPEFLQTDGPTVTSKVARPKLDEADPEVKRVAVLSTCMGTADNNPDQFPDHFEKCRLDRFSTWHRAKRAIATCLRYKRRLRRGKVVDEYKVPMVEVHPLHISVEEMEEAETEILKCLQLQHFKNEVLALQKLQTTGEFMSRESVRIRNQAIKKSSSLYRLDPFLDEKGVMRVGGRINRASVPVKMKHPAILPRNDHITELVVRHYHEKVHHMGRGVTHNEIRHGGYWVIGGSSAVSNYISRCVTCRKLRGSLQRQKMSDLPVDRLEPAPPFSYCAVDYFGPFLVKERRSQVKRYGVLFTCMASRCVHLETANSLSSSSFINALRRFQSRRGPVRQLRSDQGTTFIGARSELREALAEMEQDRVHQYLLENDCDWIPFKLNTPHASHMGGAWERQIGTVRRTLEGLLLSTTTQLDDECFRTFMTEVEGIINSRPLTTDYLCSPDAPEPLTPNHLLTMKPKVVLPPPGKFQKEDIYARKWWRRVQYLTNEFWVRWRKEFLHQLQTRKKWVHPERDLQVGDVVISKEGEHTRNQWPLGRVVETHPSNDGRVRSVKLLMADGTRDHLGRRQYSPSLLDRPVHKLVLLVPTCTTETPEAQETRDVPTEEPN